MADTPPRAPQRGIPDGALIGVLVLLIGATGALWLSTGLAGLVSHQEWPEGVRFSDSGTAIRELTAEPGDIPAAWPKTPPEALPPASTFWWVFGGVIALVVCLAGLALWAWLNLTLRQVRRGEGRVESAQPTEPPEKTI
ncbi:MAG TPA: hypothetical protein VLH10_19435 [Yinghuangia sp.]|uniref:hypothetical protein n=1 Tax=Yinghuangia sp. YIM S10712 TaxID=3436930 RepID=UPI002C2EBE6C|nr:hypothetical protein [Yinghuangia sp.]